MKLSLTSNQKGKFDPFESLLKSELPRFIREKKSIMAMIFRNGLFSNVPEFHHQGALPNQAESLKIVETALMWGTGPEIQLMPPHMYQISTPWDLIATYNHRNNMITMPKPLVEAWQESTIRWPDKPDRKVMLQRWLLITIIHELIHYFNHKALGIAGNHKPGDHHFYSFEKRVYGALGWHSREISVSMSWLETLGLKQHSAV